jgi:putative ABC transport system permease protein
MLLSYEVPDGLGGPPAYRAGRAPRGPAEVALDHAAAWRLDVGLGDPVVVNGRSAEVVGVTSGTNLVATQFVFADIEAARSLTGYRDLVSFVAVQVEAGVDPAAVADTVRRRWPEEVSVHRTEQFVANNLEEVGSGFRPMQLLVSGVGLAAAAVLVSLLVQGSLADRRRDIAVLFALGARAGAVSAAVVAEALGLVVVGAGAGAGAAGLLSLATARWVPTLELALQPADAGVVIALFAAVGALASVGPLVSLRRLDPVEAFRP